MTTNAALVIPANTTLKVEEGLTLDTGANAVTINGAMVVNGTWDTTGSTAATIITNNGSVTGSGHVTLNGNTITTTESAATITEGNGSWNLTGTTLELKAVKFAGTQYIGGNVIIDGAANLNGQKLILDEAQIAVTVGSAAFTGSGTIELTKGTETVITDEGSAGETVLDNSDGTAVKDLTVTGGAIADATSDVDAVATAFGEYVAVGGNNDKILSIEFSDGKGGVYYNTEDGETKTPDVTAKFTGFCLAENTTKASELTALETALSDYGYTIPVWDKDSSTSEYTQVGTMVAVTGGDGASATWTSVAFFLDEGLQIHNYGADSVPGAETLTAHARGEVYHVVFGGTDYTLTLGDSGETNAAINTDDVKDYATVTIAEMH